MTEGLMSQTINEAAEHIVEAGVLTVDNPNYLPYLYNQLRYIGLNDIQVHIITRAMFNFICMVKPKEE
jgi:hypothetical protein